jgi:hypothetical protein
MMASVVIVIVLVLVTVGLLVALLPNQQPSHYDIEEIKDGENSATDDEGLNGAIISF